MIRAEGLRIRHSASVARAAAAVRRPSCSHAPVTSRSPRHRALIRLRWLPGVRAWLPRLSRRSLSSHRNTATPTARWRLRWILQSSEDPKDIVDVQGGCLPREVPATVEVGLVSAGQRMGVHDVVDEISRSLCWRQSPRRPVGQAAEFWSSSRAADELPPAQPCLEKDVRARGCRPTGCSSLIREGAIVRLSASGLGSNE